MQIMIKGNNSPIYSIAKNHTNTQGERREFMALKYFTEAELEKAKQNGLSYGLLRYRVLRGLDIETAINKPPIKRSGHKEWDKEIYAVYKGEELVTTGTVYEIAEELGISVDTAKFYTYPSSVNRDKGKKRILVYIGRDDEEEME